MTVTAGSLQLNWTATISTFASGYRVMRATAPGGPYSQIAQVTPRTTVMYTDTTVSIGITYYYVVRSYYQNWESADSPQANGIVQPIALVQKATGVREGGTSVSATFGATPSQSNLLVAIISTNTSVTINIPSGWSSAIRQSGAPGQAIFYKVAGAAEATTVTVTVSASTRLGIRIFEYSNVATASPLDRTASTTGTGTSISSGTTATTTVAKELVVVGVVSNATTSFASWTNSFTEQADFANGSAPISTYGAADRAVTVTGAFATVTTAGASGAWRGQIATFKHK